MGTAAGEAGAGGGARSFAVPTVGASPAGARRFFLNSTPDMVLGDGAAEHPAAPEDLQQPHVNIAGGAPPGQGHCGSGRQHAISLFHNGVGRASVYLAICVMHTPS